MRGMSTPDEEPVFDAGQIVSDLRRCARSGRTQSLEWRLSQLEADRKLVCENEDEIYSALISDLSNVTNLTNTHLWSSALQKETFFSF